VVWKIEFKKKEGERKGIVRCCKVGDGVLVDCFCCFVVFVEWKLFFPVPMRGAEEKQTGETDRRKEK
jgi:hypothetical protein